MVIAKVVEVALVRVVLPVKLLAPEKVLLLAKSVDEAAKIVMSAEPLNDTPLMRRAVWSVVAVEALPEIEPLMVEVKVFEPEKVFEFARRVEEAAVMVILPPALNVVPLMVPSVPVRLLVPIDEVAMI